MMVMGVPNRYGWNMTCCLYFVQNLQHALVSPIINPCRYFLAPVHCSTHFIGKF